MKLIDYWEPREQRRVKIIHEGEHIDKNKFQEECFKQFRERTDDIRYTFYSFQYIKNENGLDYKTFAECGREDKGAVPVTIGRIY